MPALTPTNPAPDPATLFREREVLGPAPIGAFENRICTIKLREGEIPNLASTGVVNDFPSMQKMRVAACSSLASPGELYGAMCSPHGLVLSNVGVSVALTVTINERRFLVGVRQDRPDFGDAVVKLPSGYVNSYHPEGTRPPFGEVASEAAVRELSEEALLWRAQKDPVGAGLLRGMVSSARSVVARELKLSEGEELPLRLFSGEPRALESPYEARLPVLDDLTYSLRPAARPLRLPSIADAVPIEVDGEWVYAGVYVFQPFQAGQLVFFYELKLPEIGGLSLSHCENVVRDNKLVEEYQRFGAPLLELSPQDGLTGRMFVLDRGELCDISDLRATTLSEAFVPSARIGGMPSGIVTAAHIKLDEYLKR